MNKLNAVFAACRDVRTDETGATWFQTFPPYGRYPVGGTIKGAAKDAEFVLDEASAKAILKDFEECRADANWPGVLVDREHYSLDPEKPSDAMAWAKDIRLEPDGSIWTRWEFTPEGERLWQTRTLVNRSPAFLCEKEGKCYRPIALRSIGMTNMPHFTDLSTTAAARAALAKTKNQGEENMQKILEALGLAEGATEEEALAAITALQEKAAAEEARATEAEQKAEEKEAECRAVKCDAFIAANKGKIADEAACRAVYMANPDAAVKMMAACKGAAQAPQTVIASAKATPEVKKTAFASCRAEMASLPPKERAAYYREHAAEIDG